MRRLVADKNLKDTQVEEGNLNIIEEKEGLNSLKIVC